MCPDTEKLTYTAAECCQLARVTVPLRTGLTGATPQTAAETRLGDMPKQNFVSYGTWTDDPTDYIDLLCGLHAYPVRVGHGACGVMRTV